MGEPDFEQAKLDAEKLEQWSEGHRGIYVGPKAMANLARGYLALLIDREDDHVYAEHLREAREDEAHQEAKHGEA